MSWLLKTLPIITIIFFSASIGANAEPHKIITNYTDLITALTHGNQVRAIVTQNKCQTLANTGEATTGKIYGITFTEFLKYAKQDYDVTKNLVSAYSTTLIDHNQHGPVYNIMRIRVFDDNFVEIFNELVHPSNHTALSVTKINCHLSDGNDKNGVILFDLG